jgi:UDP-N-acetylmuramoyl-L-alanyl-D-glutamate--2,6-diaminopimelate ligase
MAREGDMVLVAGKGHENYQEIAGVRHHFDDKEVIAKLEGSTTHEA